MDTAPALPANRPRIHLEFVDGIRALAALFVMIGHAWFEPSNGYYERSLLNHLGLSYGHIAVDAFIVVSGFCLMLPIVRNGLTMPSVRSFVARRARRILPPYYAALALSCLFILIVASEKTGTVWDNSLPLTWQQLLAHVLLIQDLPLGWDGGSINYPMWSIAVEWQIYFAMPLLVLALRRLGSALTVAMAVLIGLAAHAALGRWLDGAYPWYFSLFAMGCVAALHGTALDRCRATHVRILAAFAWALPAWLIVRGGMGFFQQNVAYLDVLIGLATALTLALMLREVSAGYPSMLTRLVSWGPLVRVGFFSYSLYLVHAPLLHLLDRAFDAMIAPGPELMFLLLVAASPLVVGAAYVFSLAFERPFLTPVRLPVGQSDGTIPWSAPRFISSTIGTQTDRRRRTMSRSRIHR